MVISLISEAFIMSIIKMNSENFVKTADAMDSYIDQIKLKMHNADSNISSMFSGWQGEDAMLFKIKWDALSDEKSTFYAMSESLRNYANFLRDVKRVYESAQQKCISDSRSLNIVS